MTNSPGFPSFHSPLAVKLLAKLVEEGKKAYAWVLFVILMGVCVQHTYKYNGNDQSEEMNY